MLHYLFSMCNCLCAYMYYYLLTLVLYLFPLSTICIPYYYFYDRNFVDRHRATLLSLKIADSTPVDGTGHTVQAIQTGERGEEGSKEVEVMDLHYVARRVLDDITAEYVTQVSYKRVYAKLIVRVVRYYATEFSKHIKYV